MNNILVFSNDDGRRFSVKILRKSENYGDDDALTYHVEEPSLEFFDATGFDEFSEEEPILGYFTGIRCLISELFIELQHRSTQLADNFAVWNISETNLTTVRHWLVKHLNTAEKAFICLDNIDMQVLPVAVHTTESFTAFDALMDRIEPEEETCAASARRQAMSKAANSVSSHSLLLELERALQALDKAEVLETQWKTGVVQTRLHLLSAKKHILKIIALLNTNTK
ncbi:hypothetical protein BegalDRAFT_0397 [Beggiatoa alba B18LD]|uniref:Uncharacterized protein n=1 Tax=Beggiatoa alba B18LD TaxID=395493 RepID=I3CCH4_9GAMM|nr:hypothetical protein [Beggiatoa alba]EIJ41317.1 hypothetical protein BegalDRAFT_0397 [Beggiatoa alba B18LD]